MGPVGTSLLAAPAEERGDAGPSQDAHRFRVRLGAIALGALVLRVVYVLAVTRHDHHLYDALYYRLQAIAIVDGRGFFTDPFQFLRGTDRVLQSADHPPLTVLVLLPGAWLRSLVAMHLTMVILGTVTVVLLGLLGRALGGDRVGLVAAGIGALYANLWVNDGLLMSETLGILLTTALLLVGHRVLRHGATWQRAAALGVLLGLGMLARAEVLLFAPFLVVPTLWVGAGRSVRRAAPVVAVAGLVTVLVLAPWVAYNLNRFERPTFISTNDVLALHAANCAQTYHGRSMGWVDVFPPCTAYDPDAEQSVIGEQNRRAALDYMSGHASRIPVVALARLGRTWNVFRTGQSIRWASFEGRPQWVSWIAAVSSWVLLPLAVVGAVVLRRRREAVWPLVVVFVIVHLVLAFVSGGLLRYRASAEPVLVVLGAVGVSHLLAGRGATPAAAAVGQRPLER